jgi:hypothetical protein
MKILICLAMSFGLTAILYFYLKQRLSVIESRLATLTELAYTLAEECKNQTQVEQSDVKRIDNVLSSPEVKDESEESESEESESDSDSESDNDSVSETENDLPNLVDDSMPVIFNISKLPTEYLDEIPIIFGSESSHEDNQEVILKTIELPLEKEKEKEKEKEEIKTIILEKVEPTLIDVSDDEIIIVKQVSVNMEDYSQLSLKELKQKVTELGGPPLKTKQALLNFLKKKV